MWKRHTEALFQECTFPRVFPNPAGPRHTHTHTGPGPGCQPLKMVPGNLQLLARVLTGPSRKTRLLIRVHSWVSQKSAHSRISAGPLLLPHSWTTPLQAFFRNTPNSVCFLPILYWLNLKLGGALSKWIELVDSGSCQFFGVAGGEQHVCWGSWYIVLPLVQSCLWGLTRRCTIYAVGRRVGNPALYESFQFYFPLNHFPFPKSISNLCPLWWFKGHRCID